MSQGSSFAWSASAPDGDRVDPNSILINGAPVLPLTTYRVTVPSILADGGVNFTVLTEGTNRLGGEVELDALKVYLGVNSPVAPGPQDRITVLP